MNTNIGRRELLAGLTAMPVAAMVASRASAAGLSQGRLIELTAVPSAYVIPRDVFVWLPDDYAEGGSHYPVIYMHDGRNLFDDQRAGFGVEWGIDEHVSELARSGRSRSAIVVGIASTELRYREYGPAGILAELPFSTRRLVENGYGGSSLADDYLRFIVEELKPMIDRDYRTLSGRVDTSIMGSSMGGLISFYALTRHPKVFGGAACLSTHVPLLPIGDFEAGRQTLAAVSVDIDNAWTSYIRRELPEPGRHRLYMDHGTLGLDQFYAPFQAVIDRAIVGRGYRAGRDFVSMAFAGADHNEQSWNSRAGAPLQFLLARPR